MTDCFRRRWQQTLGSGCALLLLTPALAPAERACLRVENEERSIATFSIHRGDNFFLSFAHSIYGSIVEEQFLVIGNHLRLLRARYEELRLVEFYGHEHSHFQDGWWVVEAKPREIPSLELQVS